MTGRFSPPRVIALLAIVVGLLVTTAGAVRLADAESSAVRDGTGRPARPVASTPVAAATLAAEPLDGDPLDGAAAGTEPLDGPKTGKDPEAPNDLAQFEIARSGRPDALPRSDVAYDGEAGTVWSPEQDGDDAWLWLDLGAERRVRAVRWLAQGAGAVAVATSSDLRHWQEADRVDVAPGWQGVALREDARYVRLSLQPGDDDRLPRIAEATVYGKEGGSVSSEQRAKKDRAKSDKKKNKKGNKHASGASGGKDKRSEGNTKGAGDRTKSGGDNGTSSKNGISAAAGETRCDGDGGRCRARQGRVTVAEDCPQDGSCTIDVQADGGAAECDSSGGEENKAGNGSGKQSGDGGRCDAVADGGAVSIGDINP